MDPTTLDVIVTVVAALLLAVAVLGTIFPILPGSALTLITVVGWAWILGRVPRGRPASSARCSPWRE
ncbi:hypothetical protein [Sanguibacter sp. Z1732]|uniref:hypothetical protein n=1 Tax=Sanguibacter sp. Z1732 TaxID=3435412 RepID=UPI003D9C84F3